MQMIYRSPFAITAVLVCSVALACTGSAPQPQATQTTSVSTPGAPHPATVPPAPFPVSGYKVEWLDHKVPSTMEPTKEYHLTVTLKNAGTSTWPSKGTGGGLINQVSISYHWLAANGNKVVGFEGHRTPLPRDIPPGDSLTADNVVVTTPEAGEYRLKLTLVHEGVTWFEQQGANTLVVPVAVR